MKYIKILLFTFVFAVLLSLPVFAVDYVGGVVDSGNYVSYISFKDSSGTGYVKLFNYTGDCEGFYVSEHCSNSDTVYAVWVSSKPFSVKMSHYYASGAYFTDSELNTLHPTSGPFGGYYVAYWHSTGSNSSLVSTSGSIVTGGTSDNPISADDFYSKASSFFFQGDGLINSGNTGGDADGGTIPDSWGDSEQSAAFGSWFDSVFSWLSNIVNSLEKGFENLLAGIGKFFDDLLQGIIRIFVPEEDIISGYIDDIKTTFNKTFGIDKFDISPVFGVSSKPFQNVDFSINILGLDFSGIAVDFSFVDKALTTFRPVIRGFMVFLMFLYLVNQFLSIIGQTNMTIGSAPLPDKSFEVKGFRP